MTKSRSPCLTVAPSVNAARCTYPETRGRTSTELTASKWPVNSSQSATSRPTAGATVTSGARGGRGAGRQALAARSSATGNRVRLVIGNLLLVVRRDAGSDRLVPFAAPSECRSRGGEIDISGGRHGGAGKAISLRRANGSGLIDVLFMGYATGKGG